MSLFIRQLVKRGKPVRLADRDEKIINGKSRETFTDLAAGGAAGGLTFTAPDNDIARIRTLRGVSVFDGTNTERVATHEFRLRYRSDVGAEQWIVNFKGKNLKILTAENCCEDDNVLVLMCTERGEESKVVNSA